MADWYFRNTQKRLRQCPGCRNLVNHGDEFCPYCARRLRAEGGIRGLRDRARNFLNQPNAFTRGLIAIIAAMFVFQLVADLALPAQYRGGGGGGLFSFGTASTLTYFRLGSNLHTMVYLHNQYWRFITSCFLHFGIIHILFNCWAFWDLGRLAERFWGGRQVFATFVLTGILGSFASYVWNLYVLGAPVHSAGASGAICGILGLFLGAYYRNRNLFGGLSAHLIRWAVYILVFGLVMRADNAAHIGGMIGGGVLGYFLPPTNYSRSSARDDRVWRYATWAALVLLVVSFACMFVFFLHGPDYAALMLMNR